MNAEISVILPNYNGRHLLGENLPFLLEALKGIDNEVIVVDDCSSDDSVDMLQRDFPRIRVVTSKSNEGFSATCNKGIHAANKKLLCIVNTDVRFTTDYFTNAIQHFTNDNLFAIKGDIINYQNDITNITNTETAPVLYYKSGFLRFNHGILPDGSKMTGNINEHFVLLGCCFVCDRQKMLELDGYDEIFSPYYWEDADLAMRALEKGYELLYLPECRIYHKTSSTIGATRKKWHRQLVSYRNKFLFTWHHLHCLDQWISHIAFTFFNILSRWVILDWKYYAAFIWAIFRKLTFSRKQ
jgi:GT2 family glycosyltransferase